MVTSLSVLLGILWMAGFGWAVQDYYVEHSDGGLDNKVKSPVKNIEGQELTIVALGDSLTRGTGDETGKGYVGLVTQEVKKRIGQEVKVHNLGINGQTSRELRQQVKQKEVRRQLAAADTILLTIGGNDLFRGGQTLLDYNAGTVSQLQSQFTRNLSSIFADIRKANDKATIFYLGLYNPFIELEDGKQTSQVVREWNRQSEETSAAFNGIVFVPTFDIFQTSVNDYLYTDRFHPNKQGYRLIAERVAPLIKWEEKQE
ncbi:GDSL-type esterase/lipase family protein [Peribacillus glennii]|nr:GDSL-type esterase/lipase family protein [Peribacillus glennii]